MATSGTIGTTVINTAKMLEKALRRAGLSPQAVTPETVETAKDSLFMLLMSMTNRGLNLWCIDKKIIPLNHGQATYDLPPGTLSVLNLLQATPSRADYTLNTTATDVTATCVESVNLARFGVKFVTNPTAAFTFESSTDGLTWEVLTTVAVTDLQDTGYYTWVDLNIQPNAAYFRINGLVGGLFSDLYLSVNNREVVIAPFNRDDYANQPNKTFMSSSVTNYYFEKLVEPLLTVWPVPNDDSRHLILFRHRQMQDVGTLTDTLELPSRWIEAITWQLCLRLAFELPGIDPSRRQEVMQMANAMTAEVESGETDNAPLYYQPNIRVYNQ